MNKDTLSIFEAYRNRNKASLVKENAAPVGPTTTLHVGPGRSQQLNIANSPGTTVKQLSNGDTIVVNEKNQLHNEVGPAYITSFGTRVYMLNDLITPLDGTGPIVWAKTAVK